MKKIKGLVLALGLSLLLVPSVAKADKLTDPYIPKIRNGDILPPRYMNQKSPDVDDWIKSIESQAVGGGTRLY